MSIFYGFVIFTLFAGISGQSRFRRAHKMSCPEVKIFSAFNQTKFVGTWYNNGILSTLNVGVLQCDAEHWTYVQNGESSINETWLDRTGNKDERMIVARVLDLSKPHRFNTTSTDLRFVPHQRWILDTDYLSYAVEYSCVSMPFFVPDSIIQYAAIMTRERNPSKAVIKKAMAFINERGFDARNYLKTNQTGCEILDVKSHKE